MDVIMKKFNHLNIDFIKYYTNKNNKLISKLNKNKIEIVSIHKIINQNSNIKLDFERLNDLVLLKLVRKNKTNLYEYMKEAILNVNIDSIRMAESKKRRYFNFLKWCKKIDKLREA